MPERAKFMARITVTKLDSANEHVETTVKAVTLEKLTEKVTTILGTMEEGVDL